MFLFSIHSNLLFKIEAARDIVVSLILLFDNVLRLCMFRTIDFSRSLLAARCGNSVTNGMAREGKPNYTVYTIVSAPLPYSSLGIEPNARNSVPRGFDGAKIWI